MDWNHTCPAREVHVFVYADFGRYEGVFVCGSLGNYTNYTSDYCGNRVLSLQILQSKCSGQETCNITASEREFRKDVCAYDREYLNFLYSCFPGKALYYPLFSHLIVKVISINSLK